MLTNSERFVVCIASVLLASGTCCGEQYEFKFDELAPSSYLDRWMYPFNVTPGARIQSPTFGALGSEGFDERDGQFVLAINTAELGIATDLPTPQYRIDSATLILTETFGGYAYDPTYDSFTTYLDPGAGIYEEDEDEGRPLELYGLGLRDEFTEFAWPDGEDSVPPAFGSASPFGGEGKDARSVFATNANGVDVSNNVDSLADGAAGFDPTPFAVAKLVRDDVELEAGDTATARTKWVFDINVEDGSIHDYLADSLSRGQLGFAATSMHTTGVQGLGDAFPNPATANHFAFDGPVLMLDVELVEGLIGDFDSDSVLTAADMDLLSTAIRETSADTQFDLSSDGLLDNTDRLQWIEVADSILGDADLNGAVRFADFLSLSRNFGAHGGWMQGDFDGTGDVAFPDFLLLSQNFGRAAVTAAVPEPAAHLHVVILFALATLLRARTRKER